MYKSDNDAICLDLQVFQVQILTMVLHLGTCSRSPDKPSHKRMGVLMTQIWTVFKADQCEF